MNNVVYVVRCPDYDRAEENVQELVALMGGMAAYVPPGERAALKVNLLSASAPEQAVTTHPAVAGAVGQLVNEAGAEPFLIDSPSGAYAHSRSSLEKVYRAAEMDSAASEAGLALNYDTDYQAVSFPDGQLIKHFELMTPLLQAGVIINLPKLKTHALMSMTGGVKNLFGAIPGRIKPGYHAKLTEKGLFARMLLDLMDCLGPRLTIMDAVVGMEGDGPGNGDPRPVGLLLGAENPLALDVVAGEIMGLDRADNPLLMEAAATNQFEQGYSGFFVDKMFLWEGLDFSKWATASFRDHVQSLPDTRRNELDIAEPSTFDVKAYLRENNLSPQNDQDPREDPVFREYVIHNHLGVKEYIRSFRETLADRFPTRFERGNSAIWANQFTGNLTGVQAMNVYMSPHLDLINTELFPTVTPPSGHKYKLLQALGNFEKPVLAKATLTDSHVGDSEFRPTERYPNLERFQLAETHANGARLKIPLSPRSAHEADEAITQWIRSDGTVPETLQSMADFTWTHKRFLSDSAPQNRVALIWSLPDRMFRRLPQWGIGSQDSQTGVESFNGAAKLLKEAQIPYTVLVFGHPDLWDDSAQLERLSAYDAVVLPDIQTLTDEQHVALETFLADGGSLISSGSTPEKSGRYDDRTAVDELFSHDNAVVLTDNPALAREQDGDYDGDLANALADAGISSVTAEQDSTLAVNIRSQSQHARTIVHLLNYDYSKRDDSFDPKTEITIEIPNPEHAVGVARYYSEQQTTDIDIESAENGLTVTVPKLTDWGFVVLAPQDSDLVNAEDTAAAKTTVATLRAEVEKAKERGYDWSPKFTVAETRLEEAETALEAEAYTRAVETATEGVSTAAELDQERPVVGIDLAHGVTFNEDDDGEESEGGPLAPLQNNISYPEYRVIESWSNEKLDGLDILIVPPALAFRGQEYGFAPETRRAIIDFVEEGGSLVVLARGGVASDACGQKCTPSLSPTLNASLLLKVPRGVSGVPVSGRESPSRV